uniref:Uncharacterized protein n=1 Tax=Glossina austeni TaxID=7395 RepID=A0A1A9VG68_GLOAU
MVILTQYYTCHTQCACSQNKNNKTHVSNPLLLWEGIKERFDRSQKITNSCLETVRNLQNKDAVGLRNLTDEANQVIIGCSMLLSTNNGTSLKRTFHRQIENRHVIELSFQSKNVESGDAAPLPCTLV